MYLDLVQAVLFVAAVIYLVARMLVARRVSRKDVETI